jgi:hypothetical protein
MIALLQETTTATQEAASSGIPLSELLSGLIGALGVFLLGIIREMRRKRRVLRGLARLVHTELTRNNLTLKLLYGQPTRALTDLTAGLNMDTWESARVQMAEVMPADDLGSIAYYYLYLQELKQIQATQSDLNNPSGQAANALEVLAEQERDALAVLVAYANLGGLLGWYRMRHRLSEYRRSASEAEKSQ